MNSEKNERQDNPENYPEIEVKSTDQTAQEGPQTEEKSLDKMRKSEIIEKLELFRDESVKNYDLFLRSQADLDNLKKRAKKEKEDWIKYSNETLIKEILPILDNLENAISHSRDENSLAALREGVELTFKGLKDAMSKAGLEDVKALGEPFDPLFHQAVSEQEDEEVEAGNVLLELQKGYTLHQRLIRPSMVVVSTGKPDRSITSEEIPYKEN
ncbi:MAG: nucleotide exchange factor GrpE [Pseudomonadota bacterium]